MADDGGWLVAGSTSTNDVQRYYDELADDYDATLAAWGYDAPQRIAELVLAALAGGAGDVLDAGCGTGLSGAAVRAAGFDGRLVGIDLSPDSLALAAGRGVYDELGEADLQRPLAFADDGFDAAICVGVLTYVPDVRSIWGELARVVRPGGIIACTQRDDVWDERRCSAIADELERDGTWTITHLSPPAPYLPGNADFAEAIRVRYLAARVR